MRRGWYTFNSYDGGRSVYAGVRDGNGSDRVGFLKIQTRSITFRFDSGPGLGLENEDPDPIRRVFSGSGLIRVYKKYGVLYFSKI